MTTTAQMLENETHMLKNIFAQLGTSIRIITQHANALTLENDNLRDMLRESERRNAKLIVMIEELQKKAVALTASYEDQLHKKSQENPLAACLRSVAEKFAESKTIMEMALAKLAAELREAQEKKQG